MYASSGPNSDKTGSDLEGSPQPPGPGQPLALPSHTQGATCSLPVLGSTD